MLPDVHVLIPVVLAVEPAVSDDECGRISGGAGAPELDDIAIDAIHRQGMLNTGVSVSHHSQVMLEQRATLGHDHHAQAARSLDHLLTLVAPRLVVGFYAEGADRLHSL